MSLNGNIRAAVALTHQKDNVDLSTPSETITQIATRTFTSGMVYHNQLDLVTATAQTLTLSGGGLTDQFGQSIDFTTVRGVYAKAGASNTGTVAISGGPDMIFNPLPVLSSGQGFIFEGDISISTSNDELTFYPSLNGTVDVIIVGD